MQLTQQYITQSKYYRNPTVIKPAKLVLHSVGCPQPSAAVFARQWQTAKYPAHAVLQADGLVIQALPWDYYAPHVGKANSYSIGVEMTEPACIKYTGGAAFTCSDLTTAKSQVMGTYNTAVELFAHLCELYGLDPMRDIMSHSEAAQRGVGTNHADPEHLWRGLKTGYTMDGFRLAVKDKMEEDNMIRYKTLNDIPEGFRSETRELMELGFNGYSDERGLDVTLDMLRTMIIDLRMCKALIAAVPELDKDKLFDEFKRNLNLTIKVE